jgi:hypothetical protein
MTWRQLHTSLFAYNKKRQDKLQPPEVHKETATNIPQKIKKLLAKKRKARAKWQRSHASLIKWLTTGSVTTLNQNRKPWEQTPSKTMYRLWIATTTQYGSQSKQHGNLYQQIPLRINSQTQNSWAQSDKEKADTFAKHLADVFKPHEEESDDELPEYPQPPTQPVSPIKPITSKEVKTAIRFLHTRKAPGMDLITPTMFKELPHKGILLLTYLFNAILRLHYWPLSLKFADPTEVTSYRPISLLTTSE